MRNNTREGETYSYRGKFSFNPSRAIRLVRIARSYSNLLLPEFTVRILDRKSVRFGETLGGTVLSTIGAGALHAEP